MSVNETSVELDNIDDILIHTRHPVVCSCSRLSPVDKSIQGGGGRETGRGVTRCDCVFVTKRNAIFNNIVIDVYGVTFL